MAAIDAELLERSVQFQRGQILPSAQELIGLLDQLGEARDAGKSNQAFDLEARIRGLVPEFGTYTGYLGDDLTATSVRTGPILRKGSGANIHTFYIKLDVLKGTCVVATREIELFDFLKEIRREVAPGQAYFGPRFKPE
jgi:hypothetical protein